MGLEVELNRIASTEAVSLDTSLALVAKRRGELDLKVLQKEMNEPKAVPADGTGVAVDKVA
jgi:hypothetical protein